MACIKWWGFIDFYGYGRVSRREPGERHQMRAHRMIWRECFGEIPDGLQVLHRCDNRACVNPEHLFLGTNADNMADKAKKGRCGTNRLASSQVAEIKSKLRLGETQTSLAREYGVARETVSNLATGRTWRHVQ